MLTLYDAPRCPFCARARIVLAEKGIQYETVTVDLDERPDWLVDLNPPDGRVPVLEQPVQPLLPESRVVMRYLEERFPEPPLLPESYEERALVDLAFERFDELVSTPYYRFKQGNATVDEYCESLARFNDQLSPQAFTVGEAYSLADIAYVPWILRAELLLDAPVRDYPNIATWLDQLADRKAIQAEVDVIGSLVA